MAAFNYVDIQGRCPRCENEVLCSFQTHMASDYNSGDESGPFQNTHYGLGERMRWDSQTNPSFEDWIAYGRCACGGVHEHCHGQCPACAESLFVRITFEDVTPIETADFQLLKDWPRDPARPREPYSPTVCEATREEQ